MSSLVSKLEILLGSKSPLFILSCKWYGRMAGIPPIFTYHGGPDLSHLYNSSVKHAATTTRRNVVASLGIKFEMLLGLKGKIVFRSHENGKEEEWLVGIPPIFTLTGNHKWSHLCISSAKLAATTR